MAKWMKVLAVALAAVVGLVPAFAQVSYAQVVPESVPALPSGEELRDEDLLETEGEAVVKPVVAGAVVVGTVGLVSGLIENTFHDEEFGLDWDDAAAIANRTLTMATAWVAAFFAVKKVTTPPVPPTMPPSGGGGMLAVHFAMV